MKSLFQKKEYHLLGGIITKAMKRFIQGMLTGLILLLIGLVFGERLVNFFIK